MYPQWRLQAAADQDRVGKSHYLSVKKLSHSVGPMRICHFAALSTAIRRLCGAIAL
jgi:hypothetical protein